MNLARNRVARRARAIALGLLSAAAVILSGPAAASYGYNNVSVDQVGVVSWGTYGAFVAFVGDIPFGGAGQVPNPCINGVAYFDQTQNNAKYWYMTLLTAKASGLHVYIDLTQDGSNNCYVVGARIIS